MRSRGAWRIENKITNNPNNPNFSVSIPYFESLEVEYWTNAHNTFQRTIDERVYQYFFVFSWRKKRKKRDYLSRIERTDHRYQRIPKKYRSEFYQRNNPGLFFFNFNRVGTSIQYSFVFQIWADEISALREKKKKWKRYSWSHEDKSDVTVRTRDGK